MIGRHRTLKGKRRLVNLRHTAEEAESWDEWMAAGGLQVVVADQSAASAG